MTRRADRQRIRFVKAQASPKDLVYSTAWFIGCFLNNVMRLLKIHPKVMESYPTEQRLMMMWETDGELPDGTPAKVKAGCYIKFLEQGDITIDQWFGDSTKLKEDLEKIWNTCNKQVADAWSRVSGR